MQVWQAKLRPEQPTPFSVAVALTLTGIPGCQVASSGMLKVSASVCSHGLPPDTGCHKGQQVDISDRHDARLPRTYRSIIYALT